MLIIFISRYIFILEREDYRYSGSENEDDENQVAGEPSSIVQAQSGDTLRRNFQQIQVLTLM
jgi:TRAF2 and NCK interacting kinase